MEDQLKPGKFLKAQMIGQLGERFKNSSNYFITDCATLSNKQIEDLRKKLKKVSCNYMIIKNTMCKIAFEKVGLKDINPYIKGACGIGFDSTNPIAISKILIDFAKENEAFQLRGAYVDGKIIPAETVKELASIPPREVLLARLVGAINSPISGVVMTLSGILRKFVYALNAIKEKKEGGK